MHFKMCVYSSIVKQLESYGMNIVVVKSDVVAPIARGNEVILHLREMSDPTARELLATIGRLSINCLAYY